MDTDEFKQKRGGMFIASLGLALGSDGRYVIRGGHHSIRNHGFPFPHSTYIAEDTQTSRFVILRMLVMTPELAASPTQGDEVVDRLLRSTPGASDHLMLHQDSFVHQEADGLTSHLCLIYELYGHHLCWIEEQCDVCNLPANWIWKVFREAASALAFLHEHGIVHGGVDAFSMIICYPDIDPADGDQVSKLYPRPPPERAGLDIFSCNATGSGHYKTKPNLNFKLKLQLFNHSATFSQIQEHAGDVQWAMSKFKLFSCHPPELLKGRAGPETDIWYLGEILANRVAGMLESASMLAWSNYGHLRFAETVLGPLPDEYRHLMPPLEENYPGEYDRLGPPADTLLEKVQRYRKCMRKEDEMISKYGCKDFGEEEVLLAVDLIMGMLDYDPDKRLTAKQVLEHEFFKIPRPVGASHS